MSPRLPVLSSLVKLCDNYAQTYHATSTFLPLSSHSKAGDCGSRRCAGHDAHQAAAASRPLTRAASAQVSGRARRNCSLSVVFGRDRRRAIGGGRRRRLSSADCHGTLILTESSSISIARSSAHLSARISIARTCQRPALTGGLRSRAPASAAASAGRSGEGREGGTWHGMACQITQRQCICDPLKVQMEARDRGSGVARHLRLR